MQIHASRFAASCLTLGASSPGRVLGGASGLTFVDSWSLSFVVLVAPKRAVVLLCLFVVVVLFTLLIIRCSMV